LLQQLNSKQNYGDDCAKPNRDKQACRTEQFFEQTMPMMKKLRQEGKQQQYEELLQSVADKVVLSSRANEPASIREILALECSETYKEWSNKIACEEFAFCDLNEVLSI